MYGGSGVKSSNVVRIGARGSDMKLTEFLGCSAAGRAKRDSI
jgi:hypothetical protein